MKALNLIFFFCLINFGVLAQITANQTEGCAPLTGVVFTSNFSNAQDEIWDFGNGASATGNPVNANYPNPGIYTVNYTASSNGNQISDQIVIVVYDDPTASFTFSGGCAGSATQFMDTSTDGSGGTNIVNWEWTFGDGVPSGLQNPSHTYATDGPFTVALIVTDNNGCVGSVSQQVAPASDISVQINSNPISLVSCVAPFNVTFSAAVQPNTPGISYNWNFGNGQTSTVANPPQQTYANAGTFGVSLTVTDALGCSKTTTRTVSVADPSASFSIVGGENGVSCNPVEVLNETEFDAIFDYGDGSAATQDTFYNYNLAGVYTITMTVGDGDCSATATQTISVEIPEFEISSEPDFVCSMPSDMELTLTGNASIQNVNWSSANWVSNFDVNGSMATATVFYEDTVTYQINGDQPIEIEALIETTNGCFAEAEITNTLWMPNALIQPSATEGCAPLLVNFDDISTTFEDQPLETWEWQINGETITNQNDQSIAYTFNDPGIYEAFLIVTNSAGCIDTSWTQKIYVGEEIPLDFTFDPAPVCVGETVTFEDISNNPNIDFWHFNTDENHVSACFENGSQEWAFDNVTGTQAVTLDVVYNGCASAFSQDIVVQGAVGKISTQCNCDTPLAYTFDADIQNGATWTWDFGDGTVLENSTSNQELYTFEASGDYSVVLTTTSADGCPPYIDTLLAQVRQLESVASLNDDIVCTGQDVSLLAINSQDNETTCSRGYTVFWGDGTPPNVNNSGVFGHAYGSGGAFNIAIGTEDINGCRDTAVVVINVYDIDISAAANVITGCLPLDVNFTSQIMADTLVQAYSWDFADGNGGSGASTSHQYNFPAEPGVIWESVVTVTDVLGCTATAAVSIQPIIPQIAINNAADNSLCVGDFTSFSPNPNNNNWTYNWTINGQTFNEPTPTVGFFEAGSFNATLDIVDNSGCNGNAVFSSIVNVQNYPDAAITSNVDGDAVLCYPLQTTLTNASNYNGSAQGDVQWDLGNGAQVAPINQVSTTYQLPGFYDVAMIAATSFGCADTAYRTFEVVGPVAELIALPTSICKGDTVTFAIANQVDVENWEWDFGDGVTQVGGENTEHAYVFHPPGGQTVASLTVFGQGGLCSFAYLEPIEINQVIADFSINNQATLLDTIHCDDFIDVISNNSIGATNYLWDFGDGTSTTQADLGEFDLEPGDYDITLYILDSNSGCVDTTMHALTIFPLPDAAAMGGSICLGDTLQLTSMGGETYEWSPDVNLESTTLQEPLAYPENSIEYSVWVTDTNDCSLAASAFVTVYLPLEDINIDSTIIIGESVQLFAPPGTPDYVYAWSPEDWLTCTSCPDPIATPEEDIVYEVFVTDALECFSNTYRFGFEVLPLSSVGLPDAFTPNGDGVNDIIFVKGWGIRELITFEIYNRWGELIFKTNDKNMGWDGFYKDKAQAMDTYTYLVIADTYVDPLPVEVKGFFTLMR